jgi:type IV pilus biogenesis protein PilP
MFGALALVAFALVGCGPVEDPAPSGAASTTPPEPNIPLTAPAGVPVTLPDAQADATTLTAGRTFTARSDPFALKPNERQFDRNQEALRVFGETGGFTVQYSPPPPEQAKPEDIPEPQPYRRLAGVVVGDSILALIDMGNGQLEVIRPGQQIPGSEWRVVSIDSEKAVLRRSGNRTPRQIVVRLESPPPGMGGGLGVPGGGLPGGSPDGGPSRGGPSGGPGMRGGGALGGE